MIIKNHSDFVSGLVLAAIGAGAMAVAQKYAMGSAFRMGPGYFPSLVGGVLTMLGFGISLRALWIDEGHRLGKLAWRPLLLVLGGVLLFAAALGLLGLVIASILALAVSALASHEVRRIEIPILSLSGSAFSALLFVYGLGLPIKVWPV